MSCNKSSEGEKSCRADTGIVAGAGTGAAVGFVIGGPVGLAIGAFVGMIGGEAIARKTCKNECKKKD